LKEEKEFKPHIDGYRTYSPFKDLPYIIVKGNGIDCDNIVHDLVLVGDNKKVKYCKKNTGVYKITGANKIVELPVDKTEDVEEIFKSPKNVEQWVKEKIKSVDKNGEIRRMIN
jgi:isopentenyl phosphate kinase